MQNEHIEKDKELGHQIQKLRKRAHLTQDKLAEKADITMKYMQFIESARRTPSLHTMYNLAKALKMKVKDIFPF